MNGDLLFTLTLVTDFICIAITMWFAIYLLARSIDNPLTFRAVVALLSLGFFYINAFAALVNNDHVSTGPVRSLSILITVIAVHDLTHYMLSPSQRRKLYWVARAIVVCGVVAIVLLFNSASTEPCDPLYLCSTSLSYPWVVIDSFKAIIIGAILFNIWLIRKNEGLQRNAAIYGAVLLGASTLAYGIIGTIFKVPTPRLVSNLINLAALLLLVYSAARERTLLARKASNYDVPISLVTIAAIVGIYVWAALQIQMAPMQIMILTVLAIFTHSAYDFVREFIQRVVRRQERDMRQELRSLARETDPDRALQRFLHRGLAILCHNLQVQSGWIALREGEQCKVVASLHSMPAGTQFSRQELRQEAGSPFSGIFKGENITFASAFVGQEEAAIIGLRARNEKLAFSEEDLYWLEDIAEEIGWLIYAQRKLQAGSLSPSEPEAASTRRPEAPVELSDGMAAEELLTRLAYNPDPLLVQSVEEGFRNLNDYSKLGKSSLAAILGIQAPDHISRGKQVQQKLVEMVGQLRPPGEPPAEPLPREWYAYTILHDAYVEEKLAREIMAKLYISEGTYFRLRRQALRGVARALFETGAITDNLIIQ